MSMQVRRACRRCGSPRLSVEVIAWADYEDGKFRTLDVTEYIEPKPGGWAICHECSEQQLTEEEMP